MVSGADQIGCSTMSVRPSVCIAILLLKNTEIISICGASLLIQCGREHLQEPCGTISSRLESCWDVMRFIFIKDFRPSVCPYWSHCNKGKGFQTIYFRFCIHIFRVKGHCSIHYQMDLKIFDSVGCQNLQKNR